ncbi:MULTISPECIES: hypothetical protein [Bacillaceae]|uniref:hypothetical protein n=1 Tax=Bacillaceae TaxID=186817 RepID=UPI000BFD8344|nr:MULTISPECIES: hypothetical protein [Bacillaceae]PGT84625.1 hypothetical protein COD11_10400 [Bacillus sp. AFS040349]UGB33691.1 hypothetical protein LPC09_25900 [Metabacillus sp. B2-18]
MRTELTPLFQLNLLIHLSLPYPEGSSLNPYFNRQGYSLKQIEKTIPLDLGSIKKLKGICEPKKAVTPEVVLYKDSDKEYLLIECKVQDFDVDWTHHGTRQAAGYLSLPLDHLKNFFGLESKAKINTKVIYGVNQQKEQHMFETLQSISEKVKDTLGHAMKHDTFGIEIKPDGLYLSVRNGEELESHRVINEKTLLNNALIYIIPVDINGQLEKENGEILQTQVRNSIRSVIGKNIGPQPFSFNSTSICEKINPVWGQLPVPFKKKMRRWVHNYIKEIIEQIVQMGINVTVHEQNYSFTSVEEKKIKNVRRYLLSDRFLETGQNIFENFEQLTIDEFLDVV